MKYTPELTKQISDAYVTGAPIEEISEKYGLADRSVRAKLASLGLYKRKEYVNKQGEKPIKKELYVEMIAKLLGKDIELLESLEKVNKSVLKLLVDALEVS